MKEVRNSDFGERAETSPVRERAAAGDVWDHGRRCVTGQRCEGLVA